MKPLQDRSVHDWIAEMGVELEFTDNLPAHRLGAYLDDDRKILCRPNLTRPLEEETLWHESRHAYHRDRSCHPAIEWRAWREAAQMIVDPLAYARAERLSLDASFIARELGTTTKIIEAFRKAMLRGEILARVA